MVHSRLRKAGVVLHSAVRRPVRAAYPNEVALLVQDYLVEGLSIRGIAAKRDLPMKTVHRRLQGVGVPMRSTT